MTERYLGVDLGSTTAKAVVTDAGGAILGASTVQMGAVSQRGMQRAVDAALAEAGVAAGELAGTVATGYGRRLVPGAGRTFTEITCHARGTAAMCPGVRLVIDIGGQDSKAITVDEDGLVEDFAMNDRCASGTGRFYEVLARALECELDELPSLALRGTRDLEVSSMCATFAETEIVSLLAQGAAGGRHRLVGPPRHCRPHPRAGGPGRKAGPGRPDRWRGAQPRGGAFPRRGAGPRGPGARPPADHRRLRRGPAGLATCTTVM
jgi:predicted CoA-substrate-specific enzyme activase